jgi:hypothetical protein
MGEAKRYPSIVSWIGGFRGLLASRWGGRITYVASDVKERLGLSAVLLRPDGFVAWAGEADLNHEEASQAASRWFGEPEEAREPTSQ